MFKWGETQMKVKVGSYQGPFPALTIEEIPILPSGTEKPASSLQTGGRGRKKASMRILFDTHAEYMTFYNEYMMSTVKPVELKDGTDLAAGMIFSIGIPEYVDPWIECDITFMEV